MSMKNPMTPAGIEPVTFRFVTQHLNHCATAVHHKIYIISHFPVQVNLCFIRSVNFRMISFGGLGVACWPLVPKFAGSNPAEVYFNAADCV